MATMKAKERNRLPDAAFGIPSKRMYPLYKLDGDKLVPDKAHIESAARLFGHAANEDKPQLAKNILKAARAAGIDSSGWTEVNKWAGHADKRAETKKEKVETESAISFDVAMAVADVVLEYAEELYDEFCESVYSDDETFMESISEPDDVQEAVPGLWEDYLRNFMPSYDPKTHTVQDKPREVLYRDPKTGELFDIMDPRFMDDDIDLQKAMVVKPATRKPASWPKANSKEMNRRNAFLKRHKFDPKNGTIEIDEIDPATGQKMRIPVQFVLGTRQSGDIKTSYAQFGNGPDIPMSPDVRMQLGGVGITQKPDKVEPIVGHETAHVHQRNAIRKLARQFPHHRVLDDLLAAQARAKANGDDEAAEKYKDKADEYYTDNRAAIQAETDAIRNHIIPGSQRTLGTDAMDVLHAENPDYQRAARNASANSPFLNPHDSSPDELHADDYGEELASQYTRGRRTGARALSQLIDTPEERAAKVKKIRDDVKRGQERTIERTSSPMSRYHDAVDEINKNPKMRKYEFLKSCVEHPEPGDDIEAMKAKLFALESDPEVQELLAKKSALREEYKKVPSDKRQFVDRKEQVPNPVPAYAGIDLSTISDDDLIDKVDPSIKTTDKRVAIAKQVAAEKAAQQMADHANRRRLAKETLQAQLDSGKLTPQQEKKARQKIASIDAFERKTQDAASGTPRTSTKKKTTKPSSQKKQEPVKKPEAKSVDKTPEKKQESTRKPEEKKTESKPSTKKDELPVQPAAKKDSMTVNDQKEPKKK